MTHKFKVGDVVRRINKYCYHPQMIKGDKYTVSKTSTSGGALCLSELPFGTFNPEHFELVKSPKINTLLEIPCPNEDYSVSLLSSPGSNVAIIKSGCFEGDFEAAVKRAKGREDYVKALEIIENSLETFGLVKSEPNIWDEYLDERGVFVWPYPYGSGKYSPRKDYEGQKITRTARAFVAWQEHLHGDKVK